MAGGHAQADLRGPRRHAAAAAADAATVLSRDVTQKAAAVGLSRDVIQKAALRGSPASELDMH